MVRGSAAGLAATAALVSATVVGCDSDKGSSATSTASSRSPASSSAAASSSTAEGASPSGAQPDYSSLLIKDVGPNATADGPPTANAHGAPSVMQAFENGDYSVGDIIYVLADPASAAAQMIPTMKDELSKKVNGATQPIDVGSSGPMLCHQRDLSRRWRHRLEQFATADA
jgi:hypothetical protein